MAVKWTEQQREAIEARGGNILVAAAAGSGKTAVLVERIIRMITDTENPVSVDNLLVLTFTDAAASEMRRKIADAIDSKIAEEPENSWLREQSVKVGSACISTIHSFCSRIISNNIHLTDLPEDFSLIDETENRILQQRALNDVLESYYRRIDRKSGFKQLVMGYGGIKGDDSLRETVLKLHDFSRSLAYPRRWLHAAWHDGYEKLNNTSAVKSSVWVDALTRQLLAYAGDINEGLQTIMSIVDDEAPSDHKYRSYFGEMVEYFCPRFERISENVSFDALCGLLRGLEIKRAPNKTGIDDAAAERIKTLRSKAVQESLAKAAELMSALEEDNIVMVQKCAPIVKTLCSIVRQTERVHQRYKRERGVIDFGDLEHGLLTLLRAADGGDTPLCLRLREYYHEILLDEFQDTNSLQFEIFTRLSKADGNLFMVGDIKQCIYKFRNADPSIFAKLYKSYGMGDGGRLICLFKNFRSRAEVIDGVNYIFSSIMREESGGIDYTHKEYLINGAEYSAGESYDTEILLTDIAEEKAADEQIEQLESIEIEAENMAERICRLVRGRELLVTDKETGVLREVRFGDIAVLSRNRDGCNAIEAALAVRGVAVISESGQRYLDSAEVATVLCFLQIIDNPVQDIPLIAVMRSPMFGFSAEELAKIRACAKGRYYTAVCAAAETNAKAARFIEVLDGLRDCAKYMGVDEIVWKICNELHYFSIVGAMPSGELRQSNLKLLLERCSAYEQGSMTGLFNFIKYIEMLRESQKDLIPAKNLTDTTEAVRVMTIHKSKGLEFPVVVLLGMAKQFNDSDIKRGIIWDANCGIGLDYVDTRQRVRFGSPMKKLIAGELLASLKSEEMRLLYVAMTRAKEKLIISAVIKGSGNKWKSTEFNEDGNVRQIFVKRAASMCDWMLGAVLNHPDACLLREYVGRGDIIPQADAEARFNVLLVSGGAESDTVVRRNETEDRAEVFDADEIRRRLEYEYPYGEQSGLPIKMSVSELKRRRMPEEDYSTGLLKMPRSLITDTSEIGAAERGTITHYVLQHIDTKRTETYTNVEKQVEEMTASGMISTRQRGAVDVEAIFGFFDSELGKRLKASKRVEREFDFYMLVSPDEIGENISCGNAEDVILQGIADCFFFEDDGAVLIDYKTDRVGRSGAEARSEIYRVQIEYYARGLEAIFGVPIKEKYLYFLNCGEAVKM